MCECITGFELKYNLEETKCIESYFNVTLTVSSNNQVNLIFEEALEYPLNQSDIFIKINKNIEIFSIIQLNLTSYLIIIDESLKIKHYDALLISFTNVLYSKSNKILFDSSLGALLYGESESKYKEEYVENLRISTSNAIIVITSIVFGFSVLNLDIKSFINFKNSVELFYSAILLDIDYDIIMQAVLNQIRYSSTLPSFFEKLINPNKGVKLNSKFQKFGFSTNLFVINSGMQLMLLITSSIFYILCKIIQKFKKNSITEKILNKFEWNNFVNLWLYGYLELNLSSMASVHFCKFENRVQITDFIFSIIILVILT